MADAENLDLQLAEQPAVAEDTEVTREDQPEESTSGEDVISSPVTERQDRSKPVAWNDITSDPRWKKATDAQKSQLLSSWTATVKSQASQLPGYNEEAYKKLAEFSDKERAKIASNESVAHKTANFVYETVKGIPSFLIGAAETTAGLALGAGAKAVQTGEEALGVEPGRVTKALATQGEDLTKALISKTKSYEKTLESYVPDEKGNIPNLETRSLLDGLKKYADSGKLNLEDINKLSKEIQTSVANQYGEDIKDYENDPLRSLSSPENVQLLKAYQDTRDIAYLEHLKQNLTTSNAGREAQQDVQNLLGQNDQWTKVFGKEVGGILDSARAASADPLTLPGLLVPGGAGTGSLVKKAGKSFAAGATLGSTQTALSNPIATPGEIAEAGLETGAVFSVLGAAHEGLTKLKEGIRKDKTAQVLAPASSKAAEASVEAAQAEIPLPGINKQLDPKNEIGRAQSLDQAQADLAKETLTKLQNKEITQEQYNSILERIDNAENTEAVKAIADEVSSSQNVEATGAEATRPEPVQGAEEVIKSLDENKDVLPEHAQEAYKELIAEAKTPEEVVALKEKLEAELPKKEEVSTVAEEPAKTETQVVEEQPVGKGTTLTEELAKKIENGEDVSGFSPEDLKSAKELVDAKKEVKTIDEKATAETRSEEAEGKQEKTGEIRLNENSERYADKIAKAKETASPENIAMADERLAKESAAFDKQKARLEKELSGYKDIPGGEDAAQRIIDAAKNKHYLNTLEGRASDRALVLKNVTRDFIRKAKVLKKKGESQVSTETPVAETQTVGDTLGATENTAEANDTRKVAKETLAEVLPTLKDAQRSAIEKVQNGEEAPAKDTVQALRKIREALRKKGLDGAEIDDAIERITKNDLEPAGISPVTQEGPGLVDTKKPLDALDEKIESIKINKLAKKFTNERLKDAFLKASEDFRKIGIRANDIKFVDGPVAKNGSPMGVQPHDNGRVDLVINPKELERQYSNFLNSGFAEFSINHELLHGTHFNILADLANKFGYKSFYKFLNEAAPVVLKEWRQLEGVSGRSLAEEANFIYDPREITPEVNQMMEAFRQLSEARATGRITEQFLTEPEKFKFLKDFVQRLINAFKEFKQDSYTRYVVENGERLLGQRPLDHMPLDPLEASGRSEMVGIIGAPSPDGGYPESPLGKLTREIRETRTTPEIPDKTISEKMEEAGKKVADTVKNTGTKIDKTLRSIYNNAGNWSVFKDEMVEKVNGLKKYDGYVEATQKWNAADQQRGYAIEKYVKEIQTEFTKEQDEVMGLFADSRRDFIKLNEDLKWFNEKPVQYGGESDAAFKERKSIWEKAQVYKPLWEKTLKIGERQLQIVDLVDQYMDQSLIDGQQNGILREGIEEGYLTHIWNRASKISKQIFGELDSGKLQSTFRFSRQRKWPRFIDGIKAGADPTTFRLSEIVSIYDNGMRKAIAGRGYVRNLNKIKSTFAHDVDSEGNALPITAPGGMAQVIGAEGADPRLFVRQTKPGQGDYVPLDHPSFKGHKFIGEDTAGNPVVFESDLYVLRSYAKHIENNISSYSWLRERSWGRALLKSQAVLKSNLLSLPMFHIKQEGTHALGHFVNPFKGIKEVDLSAPRNVWWMEHGVQFRDVDGQQNFWQDQGDSVLLHKVPGLGPKLKALTDWTFKVQIPALKLQTAEETLARDIKRFEKELESGKVTIDDLAYHAATVANTGYGGLNYRDLGRSRTAQDFFKLFALAPDFLEARARFAGSALKGIATLSKADRENAMAFAVIGFGSWMAARILNKALDDDYHFDKLFSVVVGNKEYRDRTIVGDAVEAFSSFIPYLNEPEGSYRFVQNRFSPLSQLGVGAANVLSDATKGNPDVAKEQFKKTLFDLATTPVPLGFKGPLLSEIPREFRPTGEFMQTVPEAIVSSFGVTPKMYTNAGEIQKKASRFVQSRPDYKPQGVFPASQYTDLRTFIRKEDMELAKRELLALEKGGIEFDKIYKAFKRASNAPFTGDVKLEPKFYATLDEKEKEQYRLARQEKREMLMQLLKLQGEIQKEKSK